MKNIDMKELTNQVSKVLCHSQDLVEARVENLMKDWAKNKSHIIDAFGGLTYEVPEKITFSLSNSAKEKDFKNLITLCNFRNSDVDEARDFLLLQGIEAVFSNKVLVKYKDVPIGMKLSKALRRLNLSENDLTWLQSRISELVQKNSITGTLVASVHPLDFLSSSENAFNWTSCHGLTHSYGGGNLSYMADDTTFIVYLKAEEDMDIPNFPFKWNSKKWRVLSYINKDLDLVLYGKEYPFSSEGSEHIVAEKIFKKVFKCHDDSLLIPVSRVVECLIMPGFGALNFNDCLSFNNEWVKAYTTEETLQKLISDPKKTLHVGAKVNCICCGEAMITVKGAFFCDDCGDFCTCDCCGDNIEAGEEFILDGNTYCEYCYDEESVHCCDCGSVFSIYSSSINYSEKIDDYICNFCANN